jgi:hypothetical protein
MAATKPKVQTQEIGQNVVVKTQGSKMTIEIDLNKDFGLSKSGKSIIISSTRGNAGITGSDLKVSLNVYRPNAQ